MSGPVIIVVLVFITADACIAAALIHTAVRTYWSPIADRFPPVDIAADAILREFQSCGAVILNLTWCIHIAADEAFLHLRPALLARVLGIRSASIPWEEIRPDPADRRRRARRASITGHTLELPRWCIELAAPPSPPTP